MTREVDSEVFHAEVLTAPFHASEMHGLGHGNCSNEDEKLHILIIDADSEDPRYAVF